MLILVQNMMIDFGFGVVQEMMRFVVHHFGYVMHGLHLMDCSMVNDLSSRSVTDINSNRMITVDCHLMSISVMIYRMLLDVRMIDAVDYNS